VNTGQSVDSGLVDVILSGLVCAPSSAMSDPVLSVRVPTLTVAHEHIELLHPRCLRMLGVINSNSSLFCTFPVFVTTNTEKDKEPNK
jgi:hypothetical protein